MSVEFTEYLLKAFADFGIPAGMGMVQAMEVVATRLAAQWARMAASTAPMWRTITVANPLYWQAYPEVASGTSWAATVSGAGALAIAGVSIVVAVGVWVSLGAGYYEARKIIQRRAAMTGFSQGFVMGVLKWQWQHVVTRFAITRPIRRNDFDPDADLVEAVAYNEALFVGFGLGRAAPEAKKKLYRQLLRAMAGRHDNASWSANADIAHGQQTDYVIALAGAGVKTGLIVPE